MSVSKCFVCDNRRSGQLFMFEVDTDDIVYIHFRCSDDIMINYIVEERRREKASIAQEARFDRLKGGE